VVKAGIEDDVLTHSTCGEIPPIHGRATSLI
jgi:hypothetical protein